jgi:membrane-associated phospholipid phosphatase
VTPGQSARRLVLLGVASAALVVPIWAGTTQTLTGQQLADLILYGATADPATFRAADEALTAVSLAFAAIAGLGLATIALAHGGFGLALAAVALVAGANLTSLGLKILLERPNLLGDVAYATGNSFPSGTVTLAASIGLASVLVAPRRIRTFLAFVAATLIAAVGVGTMVAGWHRLADVEGAILISLAWASLVTAVLVLTQGWMPRRTWGRGRAGRATTFVGVLGVVAVIAGAVLVTLVVADEPQLSELIAARAPATAPLIAALVIAVGTSLVASAGYVWAMRGVAIELPG